MGTLITTQIHREPSTSHSSFRLNARVPRARAVAQNVVGSCVESWTICSKLRDLVNVPATNNKQCYDGSCGAEENTKENWTTERTKSRWNFSRHIFLVNLADEKGKEELTIAKKRDRTWEHKERHKSVHQFLEGTTEQEARMNERSH